jgi:hypothetical protein
MGPITCAQAARRSRTKVSAITAAYWALFVIVVI